MNALITDTQRVLLLANGRESLENPDFDPAPVVKLFTPDAGATWLLTEIDPDDHDHAFGHCDLAQVGELEFQQEALDPVDVVGIMRREEQVDVDGRCLRGFDPEPQFDVGEYQTHARQTSTAFFVDDLLVAFNAEVVGDTHRANRRVRRLDGVQERCPRI